MLMLLNHTLSSSGFKLHICSALASASSNQSGGQKSLIEFAGFLDPHSEGENSEQYSDDAKNRFACPVRSGMDG